MRSLTALTVVSLVLAAAATAGATGITIDVVSSLGPNGYGSPSYSLYRSNAVYALEHSLSAYGDPNSPTYYQAAPSTLSVSQNLVTSFPSWNGQADPGTVFGPAFANELGNRLLFGVHVLSDGQQFSISQLSFVMTSTDPGNSLGYSYAAGAYNYSADYMGINYGPDGHKGGGDDVAVTGGVNTQLVNELVGRGSGNAWWPTTASTVAAQQAALDLAASSFAEPFFFTGTYTLALPTGGPGITGSDTVEFVAVPEPVTMAGLFLGLAGLGGYIRRRRAA